MIEWTDAYLEKVIVHRIGDKVEEEGIKTSSSEFEPGDEAAAVMKDLFVNGFKDADFFRFSHPSDLPMNEMFSYSRQIFDDPTQFLPVSLHIARHLYESSDHPNIKPGELCIILFDQILIEDELVRAIGLFKSEEKDQFIQFSDRGDVTEIDLRKGVHKKRLDKGAVIFDTEREDGMRLMLIDKISRDSQFWRNKFLQVDAVANEDFYTSNVMDLCRNFCKEVVAEKEDKKEQVEFLNKSLDYFSQKEMFSMEEFKDEVLEKPEYKEEFAGYVKQYEEETGKVTEGEFAISKQSVKKEKRKFKNLIKLDTNIEIRLKSDEQQMGVNRFVERGYDESRRMKYYKVYFNEES